jgi:hypothetical protein
MGAVERVWLLCVRVVNPLIRQLPLHGHSHAFHGRRGHHILLSCRHPQFTEVGWGHSASNPESLRLHLHRDNAVFWEFYENFADRFLGTRMVRGLEDTIVDLILGVSGALVLILLYRKR